MCVLFTPAGGVLLYRLETLCVYMCNSKGYRFEFFFFFSVRKGYKFCLFGLVVCSVFGVGHDLDIRRQMWATVRIWRIGLNIKQFETFVLKLGQGLRTLRHTSTQAS